MIQEFQSYTMEQAMAEQAQGVFALREFQAMQSGLITEVFSRPQLTQEDDIYFFVNSFQSGVASVEVFQCDAKDLSDPEMWGGLFQYVTSPGHSMMGAMIATDGAFATQDAALCGYLGEVSMWNAAQASLCGGLLGGF